MIRLVNSSLREHLCLNYGRGVAWLIATECCGFFSRVRSLYSRLKECLETLGPTFLCLHKSQFLEISLKFKLTFPIFFLIYTFLCFSLLTSDTCLLFRALCNFGNNKSKSVSNVLLPLRSLVSKELIVKIDQ